MPSGTTLVLPLHLLWKVRAPIVTNFLSVPLHFLFPMPCCRSLYCSWGFNRWQSHWNILFHLRCMTSLLQRGIVAVFLQPIYNTAMDNLWEPLLFPITLSPAVFEGMRRSHWPSNWSATAFRTPGTQEWSSCFQTRGIQLSMEEHLRCREISIHTTS